MSGGIVSSTTCWRRERERLKENREMLINEILKNFEDKLVALS